MKAHALPRGRGQVSTEMLISVLILLFIFLIVQLFVEQNKQQSATIQQNVLEQEVCGKLSSIITYMSSNPPYTETTLELQADANVVNGRIFVGDLFCPFFGKAANVQLYAGVLRAFDINDTVVFTNDLNYSPFNPTTGPPDTDADVSEGLLLLIDDQSQTWVSEVQAADTSYAVSADNSSIDPDWVEFRFPNLGLTSANVVTRVHVLMRHFESNLAGLDPSKRRIQCYNGSTWMDIEPYEGSFTKTNFLTSDLASCITDYNLANNARIRMTYEPNGEGDTISIDYGRIDLNFLQSGTVLNLWEHTNDLPQPLDFRTDVNSTGNTFGALGADDGWDWNRLQYGGTIPTGVTFNADPNYDGSIADSNVSNDHFLAIRLGGAAPGAPSNPDDSAIFGPVSSGAYGIRVDVNAQVWSALQGGSQMRLSFTYTIDPDAGWGNALDSGEKAWVKARFGNATSMTYLGTDLDTSDVDADSTPELYWRDPPAETTGFVQQDVTSLVTGPGSYYLELGAGITDWDQRSEGVGVYFDNVNLVVV